MVDNIAQCTHFPLFMSEALVLLGVEELPRKMMAQQKLGIYTVRS